MPPDPRPEDEQDALKQLCFPDCSHFGDTREVYEVAAVCQLDAPPSDQEPCRKKAMVAAYLKRLRFRGGECEPWRRRLAEIDAATI